MLALEHGAITVVLCDGCSTDLEPGQRLGLCDRCGNAVMLLCHF